MKFPSNLAQKIYRALSKAGDELRGSYSLEEIYSNTWYFDFLENPRFKLRREILAFLHNPKILPFTRRNTKFAYPYTSGDQDQIDIGLFEDFCQSTLNFMFESQKPKEVFANEYYKFEEDFFSDKVKVKSVTYLSSFYYNAGGFITDLIPEQGCNLRWLHGDVPEDKVLFYNLKKSIESSFPPIDNREFRWPPIIVEYEKEYPKATQLSQIINEAYELFQKINFGIRLICGGSGHFDYIRVLSFGNNSAHSYWHKSYPENHLFIEAEGSTTIDSGPYETWIKRLWPYLSSQSYLEFMFIDTKFRDSYSRSMYKRDRLGLQDLYAITREFERIIDLTQILENAFGEETKRVIEILCFKRTAEFTQKAPKLIQDMDFIRDKYLHGRPSEAIQRFKDNYGKVKIFHDAISSFEYYVKQCVIIRIMNPNIWRDTKRFRSIEKVPKFNTIYY